MINHIILKLSYDIFGFDINAKTKSKRVLQKVNVL